MNYTEADNPLSVHDARWQDPLLLALKRHFARPRYDIAKELTKRRDNDARENLLDGEGAGDHSEGT